MIVVFQRLNIHINQLLGTLLTPNQEIGLAVRMECQKKKGKEKKTHFIM
jgi:hypothetical protein